MARVLRIALLSLLVLLLAGLAEAAAATCEGADADPVTAPPAQVAATTLCLLNAERAERGLAPLTRQSRLDLAAVRHASDMVARRYFAHRSPEGKHSTDRIRATGYLSSASSWVVGENLAWGTWERATPESIVAAWMDSPGHRANVLHRRYREIGIGIVLGNPVSRDGAGATYATTFGHTAGGARRSSKKASASRKLRRARVALGPRARVAIPRGAR